MLSNSVPLKAREREAGKLHLLAGYSVCPVPNTTAHDSGPSARMPFNRQMQIRHRRVHGDPSGNPAIRRVLP